jgi:hypothetical protein
MQAHMQLVPNNAKRKISNKSNLYATDMQLLVRSNAKRRKIRTLCSLILTMPIGKFAHFAAYYQNYPVTNTELIAIMHGYHAALIHHVNLCFHFSAWVCM